MKNASLSRWISLGALALAFVGVDLLIPLLIYTNPDSASDDWLQTVVFALIGAVMGQVAMLAVWSAYAPHRLLTRVIGALLLALLIWCTIQLGANLGYAIVTAPSVPGLNRYVEPLDASGSVIIGGMILTGFLTLQGAMWIVRLIFGWRLRDATDVANRDESRFGLRQLMIWTAAVGIVLGICRFVLPSDGWKEIRMDWGQIWVLAVASLHPVIIAVPSVWLCLRKNGRLGLRLLVLGALTLVATLTEALLVYWGMAGFSPFPPPGEMWTRLLLMSLSVNFGQAAALVCTLLVVRLWGYRLVGRQEVVTNDQPDFIKQPN